MKRFFAFVMAMGLIINTGTVFAAENGSETAELGEEQSQGNYFDDYVSAGGYLAGVIEYIEKNYVGGDVNTEKLIAIAVAAMAESLDDYSAFYTEDEYDKFLNNVSNKIYDAGFAFEITEDYPIISVVTDKSTAQSVGLMAGDKISVINGKSTLNKSFEEVQSMLIDVEEPIYNFTIIRNNKAMDISFNLDAIKAHTVFYKEMDELLTVDRETDWDSVAYVQITAITDGTAEEFKEAVKWARARGMDKMILDLRGNAGGVVDEAIEICRQIVPEGRIMYTQDKTGNIEEIFSELSRKPFKEIAVLTNSMTASAAEIIASAVKESEAGFCVGTKTYGKGVVQTVASLPSLGMLKLTTLEYFSRNGNIINGVGVTPDIEISTMSLVTENDTLESRKVKDILNYLGYKNSTDNEVYRALATFQARTGIPTTVKLDAETINSLNIAVFVRSAEHDDALERAFEELMKIE